MNRPTVLPVHEDFTARTLFAARQLIMRRWSEVRRRAISTARAERSPDYVTREMARRQHQIARGQLRYENGLMTGV